MTTSAGSTSRTGPLGLIVGVSLAISLVAVGIALFLGKPRGPQPVSPEYRKAVSAFYTGLAGLEVNELEQAKAGFTEVTGLFPEEPAAWANLGLARLRGGLLEEAVEPLQKAQTLAPDSAELEMLLAKLESARGRFPESIAHLRRATELDPKHLQARYALAQELERAQGPEADLQASQLLQELVRLAPDNLALLLETARLAAKRGDAESLRQAIAGLSQRLKELPPEAQPLFQALEQAAGGTELRAAVPRAMVLRNFLVRLPVFRDSLARIQIPADRIGQPIDRFLKLAAPVSQASEPDRGLSFLTDTVAGNPTGQRWDAVLATALEGDSDPVLFALNGSELRRLDGNSPTLAFPNAQPAVPPTFNSALGLDWSHDFRTDLALCGAGGVRLHQQQEDGSFAEVTATAVEPAVAAEACRGVWSADLESDGDLDLVQSLTSGICRVLRNNGDGTFHAVQPFPESADVRDFGWADVDQDGDPDAVLLDAEGRLRLAKNERAGRFLAGVSFADLGRIAAFTTADLDRDGRMDLVALHSDGRLLRISGGPGVGREDGAATPAESERAAWNVTELTAWASQPAWLAAGGIRLLSADLDNNGAVDLLISGPAQTYLGLADQQGALQPVEGALPLGHASVIVDQATGRIGLVGLNEAEQPARSTSRGTKKYHWQVLRPRAQEVKGDQRINSFALGGELELRAGLLAQKQTITGPLVHFGLGEHEKADLARILWPNGVPQVEFSPPADRAVTAQQRLKGSCPWLFAYDGQQIRFITDILWRSPLGLRINAQDTAGVAQTEDRVKIEPGELVPRNGRYDLRITAELWETHFFDSVGLLAVDHPVDTEVWLDERFVIPPVSLDLITTGKPMPILRAVDEAGRDVTDLVRQRDGRTLDTFPLGRYQGLAADHFVEFELGPEIPADRPLWLLASGWLYPTDSSINLALGQSSHAPPRPLSLEAADAAGGWRTVHANLGFPAGKNKTIRVDLTGVFQPGAPRRLRLGTNLEVYWDALEIAEARPDVARNEQSLAPVVADLRYRGFSVTHQAGRRAPDLPDYNVLRGTEPLWIDLVGYYTRFGNVLELLAKTDDRSVILNAGDEIRLEFEALPDPPQGWQRSFVFLSDGWEKDGDFNTGFSKTVLPLPSHDQPAYSTPPTRLEDDPVYRRFPEDWQTYHTRYVTPDRLFRALWPEPPPSR